MPLSELEPAPSFNDVFHPGEGIIHQYHLPFQDRSGHVKLVVSNNMAIVDSLMVAATPTAQWGHYNEKPFVEMNFVLEGNMYQTHEGVLKRHLYAKGYHNILFNPDSREDSELIGTGRFRNFGVHISPQKMIDLLTGYIPELEDVANKIEKGVPFVLHTPSNYISAPMRYLFDTFWNTPEQMGLRRLHIESYVLELLCLQTQALLATGNTNGKPHDKDKLYYARDILLSRLIDPPGLSELSKMCCLNEFKLKKGFRELFHNSVLGFVQDQRLEAARYAIYEGKSISEIAYRLGYSHPQHFHRAFKKKFGITPKGLLK